MDTDSFSNIILPHSDRLYRMAKSILSDEEAAKDAVQELYLKLWQEKNDLKNIENILHFALKILRNICIDMLRKQKKSEIVSKELLERQNEISQQNVVEIEDITMIIKQLINNLPELQKTIIRLRDVEGFEIKEIAYITNSNENAVTVNLSRARQKIKEELIKMNINTLK